MGARGPQPQPTAIRLLNGVPGHRPINKFEPQPPKVADAPPPDTLRLRAKQIWKKMVPMLANVGLLTEVDLPLLERYCDFLVDYEECCEFLKNRGSQSYAVYARDKSGAALKEKNDAGQEVRIVRYLAQYPQVGQKIRLSEHLLKIEMHFGMTPAARTRIMLQPDGSGAPLGSPSAGNYSEDPFEPQGEDDGSGRLPN